MSDVHLYPREQTDDFDLSPRLRQTLRRVLTVAVVCALATVGSIVVQSADPGAMQFAQSAHLTAID